MDGTPAAVGDAYEAAVGVVRAANAQGIPLKLIGGQAVRLLCPLFPHRARDDQDMDFACISSKKREVIAFFAAQGFLGDQRFNTLHGDRQMYFTTPDGKTSVDVVMDRLNMCHVLDFRDRIDRLPDTLDVADLLLTKLQVVELNEKDASDALDLLTEHDLARAEGDAVNLGYLDSLVAGDWGLWRTITGTLERLLELAEPDTRDRIDEVRRSLNEVPKTRRWKLRARVGERVRWYVLPDEVE
jgi:hypothetical protein